MCEDVKSHQKCFQFHSQRVKQENEMLKSYLKASQDDVASLLDEKRTLMDTIKSLQVSPPPLKPLFLHLSHPLTEPVNFLGATRRQEIVHRLHAVLR